METKNPLLSLCETSDYRLTVTSHITTHKGQCTVVVTWLVLVVQETYSTRPRMPSSKRKAAAPARPRIPNSEYRLLKWWTGAHPVATPARAAPAGMMHGTAARATTHAWDRRATHGRASPLRRARTRRAPRSRAPQEDAVPPTRAVLMSRAGITQRGCAECPRMVPVGVANGSGSVRRDSSPRTTAHHQL